MTPDREDLPWLACDAAIELDNLRLKRQETFENVRALALRIREELGQTLQMVMLWKSLDGIIDDRLERVRTTDQVAAEIEALSGRLLAIADAPGAADIDEVNRLRDYALYLSIMARAEEDRYRQPHYLAA